MSKKSTVMTEGAIWKEILFFSIPLILGNLFQQLYNTVDSIIVGNWIGSEALAAVGSSGAIINLLVGFCIGASAGAGVVVSQFFGAGNREGVRKAVHTTLAIAVAAGAILTVAGVVTTPMILRAMDTPQEVFEQSSQYLQVYFGGIFFSVIYNMSAGILNAVGNSRRSLIYLIIAAVSIVIAWNPESSVFQIVSFAWAGFGATFGPVMLCALFWKRSNKWGALAGLISGGVLVFVWKFCIRPLGGVWDLYELLPAFLIALLAIILVSLLTKKPDQELVDEFKAVQAACKK